MQVVAHLGDFQYLFQVERDAEQASAFLTVQVRGHQETLGDYLFMPYGSSYADIMVGICSKAAAMVLTHLGITLGPDDTIQVFGGPQPTLADLGG